MTIKTAPLAETSTLKLEKDILFFFLTSRRYTKDILRGLDHIHSRGLVHCDIQADNTLLVAGKDAVSWLGLQILDWLLIYLVDTWALGRVFVEMMTAEISAWGSFGRGLASRDDLLELIAFSSEVPEFPSNISEDGRDFLSKCFIRVHQLRWTAKHVLAHPFPSVDE
ncbi:mitogen-activated protein kinase kinase kinase 17 [Citrus clementina]|uniref:mitogen-activated protein kinase kinase kinase 17 n=1 Tax=Citrus clementina TaxID=85681 RepID=UPI000CECEC46|nr:mitogen-activated protein kinase kinase kinase 17 [Citrus x clementina]